MTPEKLAGQIDKWQQEQEFQGLWVSKFRDTYLGGKTWMRKHFPGSGLEEVLSE